MSFERPIGINALYAELRALAEKPFYIMRHGKTQDDVDGVWSGWDEVDLTPEAEQDVRRAAEFLRPLGIKRIVASPTRRTQHTAADCFQRARQHSNHYGLAARGMEVGHA